MKKLCFKCPLCGVNMVNFADIKGTVFRDLAITHIESHVPYNKRVTKPENSKSPTYRSYQRYIKKLKDMYGDHLRLIGKEEQSEQKPQIPIFWKG